MYYENTLNISFHLYVQVSVNWNLIEKIVYNKMILHLQVIRHHFTHNCLAYSVIIEYIQPPRRPQTDGLTTRNSTDIIVCNK